MLFQENSVVADRFRLVRMIGRGGMGSVWQAMHLSLDRPCAVKFIEGELANVAEAHARFEREAKAAAKLHSPHVVQIFDHGVWQGHPFIAMELLDGEDLGKRLAQANGMLPPSQVAEIVQQVCRALSKAHQAGVVHRDLKPDNIFLVKDDDNPEIVKILDFGVAKQTSQAIDGSNTKTGAMLGTPYYMSPEQAQGIKSVDSRSDLWSLAVIVFQCLTGRLPFESEALGDLLVKIIVNPIPMPSSYNPNVPPGFDRWWGRAADRNPENRFQTAKEFGNELAAALGAAVSESTDRTAAHAKFGAATALMAQQPAQPPYGGDVRSNVPNTPFPGQAPQQHTAMVTPNPAGGPGAGPGMNAGVSPGSYPGIGGPPPNYNTPQNHPQYGNVAPPHASTGNPVAGPATFSGVDSPGVPKKSPPIAIFAVIAALALVGLGLGGFAILKGRKPTAEADPAGGANSAAHAGQSASGAPTGTGSAASVASVATTESADAAAPSEVATAAGTETTPAASASVAAADPTPTAKPASTGNAGVGTKPVGTKPVGTKPAASAATTAAAASAKTGGKEKPINLGF